MKKLQRITILVWAPNGDHRRPNHNRSYLVGTCNYTLVITLAPVPGSGVRAQVAGNQVEVGSQRIFADQSAPAVGDALIVQVKTLLYVRIDDAVAGILAAADTLRPEASQALAALKELGVRHIELLTGDNERTASAVAGPLRIGYRAKSKGETQIFGASSRMSLRYPVTSILVNQFKRSQTALSFAFLKIVIDAA